MNQDSGYTFPIFEEDKQITSKRVEKNKKNIQSFYTITKTGIDTGLLGETLFKRRFPNAKYYQHAENTPSKIDFVLNGKNIDVKAQRKKNDKYFRGNPNFNGHTIPNYTKKWYYDKSDKYESTTHYAFIELNSDLTECYFVGIISCDDFYENAERFYYPGQSDLSWKLINKIIWRYSILPSLKNEIDFDSKPDAA